MVHVAWRRTRRLGASVFACSGKIRVSPKNENVKRHILDDALFPAKLCRLKFIAAIIHAATPFISVKSIETGTITMSVPAGSRGLRFPCECISSRSGAYSDPWADITRKKLMPNGTKEEILNVLAKEPNTITQIASALGLSAPSVHTHVSEMLRSELLREAVECQKTHPAERYYAPNFPVLKAAECAEFKTLCAEMSNELVALFESKLPQMRLRFDRTSLSEQGWELADITQCLFASTYRGARTMLEQRGLLSPRKKRANGAEWIFWAEEPETDEA
jgi:DNA-binding transcriptional ArsR family regulator